MIRSKLTAVFEKLKRQFEKLPEKSRRPLGPRSPVPAVVELLETRVMLSAPDVLSVAASSITDTTATIGGNVTADGGNSVTERGVIYALTSDNSNPQIGGANVTQIVEGGTGTGPFSVPVTGLTPLSGYSYVAYAINGDGTTYSSPVSTFTTLEALSLIVTTTADVVDNSDGVTSLREALNLANNTAGADTITFGGAVFSDANPDTITLSLGELSITDSVTISGTGASSLTINGNNASRVIIVDGFPSHIDVTLSGMTITGGKADFGGGIVNLDQNLTLLDSVITGNSSLQKGGGVWADGFNMTLTIRRTEITNNTSGSNGGGIYVEDTGALLTIEDSTISGNHANGDGGGIYFYDPDSDILISRSTISENTATGKGGGIYLYHMDAGTVTIENSTISGNSAATGGGIYLYNMDHPVTIRNSTIANNIASTAGGGLLVFDAVSGNVDITNTILAGNTANGTPDDLTRTIGTFNNVTNNVILATSATTLDGATVSDNILGQDPLLGALANNGGFTRTHALPSNSVAVNVGTTVGAPTVDQRGVARDSLPDIGAFELAPPVLANLEVTPQNYFPNAPATVITTALTLSDADSTSLTGATVQISAGYQTGDSLVFTSTPNIAGVFNPGTGVLTLSGSDTVANYQLALQSVKYVSISQSPAARTVSFQVTDGVNLSNIASRTIGGFAQLVGSSVNVFGTPQVNNITVGEGATLDIVVDGVLTQFTPAQVSAINVFGFSGDDSIQISSLTNGTSLIAYGMGGNDTLRVSAGVTQWVTLNGGAGSDLLIGGSGDDILVGGTDDDWLNGGGGFNSLTGGLGDDVYAFSDTATNQIDTVIEQAGEGTDALNFQALTTAVTVNLTSDSTLATMSHRIVQVGSVGQSANLENVFGSSANDFITGNAAHNGLYGNGGNDTLSGGDSDDQLEGGQGNDLLRGGNQNDVLIGGVGDDYLVGDAGNDLLNGGDGFNYLAGGIGNDNYLFVTATINQIDTVVEEKNEGTDTLDFSALTTAVTANLSSDTATATMDFRIVQSGTGLSANLENVIGGSGNDQITGNGANNLLYGNNGNDTISGGAGNDVLIGGDGNDTLIGVSGRNLLIGSSGADLLLGGTGEDLLLSGTSLYESDPAILQVLLAEWASGNSYQMRVDHLLGTAGGGANTSFNLTAATVDTDRMADYLVGGTGRDWFLASSVEDAITDQAIDEIFTHIDDWGVIV